MDIVKSRRTARGNFAKGQPSANPFGAPRKLISAKQLQQIVKLAAKGCNESTISRALGMSQATFMERKKEFLEIGEAIDKGREVMHDALVGKLYERATKGDIIAAMFLLKTRHAYREGEQLGGGVHITLTLPGALSAEQYAKGLTIEHENKKLEDKP